VQQQIKLLPFQIKELVKNSNGFMRQEMVVAYGNPPIMVRISVLKST
jgi:hypothetical protein